MTNAIEDLLRNVSGPIGIYLRRIYYRMRFKKFGKKVSIDVGVCFTNPHFISIGDNVWIDRQAVLIAGPPSKADGHKSVPNPKCEVQPGEISIGGYSHIGIGTIIQGHAGVEIGEFFTTSARCSIYSLSNDPRQCSFGTVGNSEQGASYIATPIKIGRNVWLGLNCIVLGATIGDDCFAKPFSLLLGTYSNNQLLSGNPATGLGPRLTANDQTGNLL